MGQDKALLDFAGRPLVEAVIDVAMQTGQTGTPPILIVNREQFPDARYRELAGRRGIRLAAEDHDRHGPLGGLATALDLCAGARGVVLLACDMPFLTAELLRYLISGHLAEPDEAPGVTMPLDRNGRRQPLVAVYDGSTRPVVETMIRTGERRLEGLSHRVPTRLVPFEELRRLPGHERFFTNLNRPDDLEAAGRLHPPPLLG